MPLFLLFALALLVNSPAAAQKPDLSALETLFTRIAGAARGRVGAALIHLESGATLHVRGHERFPMASVVKLPIAIEVLTQVAERTLTLDRVVWLGASDIRPCCMLERRHPRRRGVAHKTGTTAVVINDAGIITLPPDSHIAGSLALVVYVADGSSIAAMERSVAQLSAAAFEFFTGRKLPRSPPRRRRRPGGAN